MKKLVALVLAVLLMATATAALAEGETIRWLTTGDTGAVAIEEGDRVIAAINEMFGINLDMQYVPDGNVEKVNVSMASGDFPDIVTGSFGTSATQSWIDNGMVISLNPYFEANPEMAAWCEGYDWSAVNGEYYGMPFITQYNAANALLIVRQDWLDATGLSYPTTLDEAAEMFRAFTFDDPDGDGQDNTYGYTSTKPIGNFAWVFYAFGRQYGDYELAEDGTVIPFFESECFIPAMEYIKGLWDEGVIDKEFMLNSSTMAEEKFYQGTVGSFVGALYRHVSRIEGNLQALYPETGIVYGKPPVGPDGVSFGMNAQGRAGFMTCITTACKTPEKAAEFLNFMVSEEGNDMVRLGIEGVHYNIDSEGQIVMNMEEREQDAFAANGWAHALAWGSLYWPLESNYMPVNEPARDRALETVTLASEAQHPSLIKQKTPLEVENGSALGDIYNQYFIDILQGKYTVEDGAARLSAEWRSQGGEELLAELTASLQG